MHVPVDKTDADIKNDVQAELDFEPTVKVTDIGVDNQLPVAWFGR